MMVLDVTAQLAPMLWGMVALLLVSGFSILAAAEKPECSADPSSRRAYCADRDEGLPEAA